MTSRDLYEYKKNYLVLPFEEILEEIRRRKILEIIRELEFYNVLEIGCGRKSIFTEIDPINSGLIVEPIQEFLNSNLVKINKSKVTGFNGTFESYWKYKSNDEKFDLIILSSVLHEFEDTDINLEICEKLTKNNGYVICVVPNKFSLHKVIFNFNKRLDVFNEKTVTEKLMQQRSSFTMSELEKVFSDKNYETKKIFTWFIKPFTHKKMQEMIERNDMSKQVLDFLEKISEVLGDFGAEIIYLGEKK